MGRLPGWLPDLGVPRASRAPLGGLSASPSQPYFSARLSSSFASEDDRNVDDGDRGHRQQHDHEAYRRIDQVQPDREGGADDETKDGKPKPQGKCADGWRRPADTGGGVVVAGEPLVIPALPLGFLAPPLIADHTLKIPRQVLRIVVPANGTGRRWSRPAQRSWLQQGYAAMTMNQVWREAAEVSPPSTLFRELQEVNLQVKDMEMSDNSGKVQ
jgi:hypothetical protein